MADPVLAFDLLFLEPLDTLMVTLFESFRIPYSTSYRNPQVPLAFNCSFSMLLIILLAFILVDLQIIWMFLMLLLFHTRGPSLLFTTLVFLPQIHGICKYFLLSSATMHYFWSSSIRVILKKCNPLLSCSLIDASLPTIICPYGVHPFSSALLNAHVFKLCGKLFDACTCSFYIEHAYAVPSSWIPDNP